MINKVDYYEVFINNSRIGKSISRQDAYEYIKEENEKILPYLEYKPVGVGEVDIWQNPIIKIEIRRQKNTNVDILEVIKQHNISNNNSKQRAIVRFSKEINVTKVMPCTPRRTRIKNKEDNLEEAVEGKIIEKNGKKYISMKDKNGEVKWEIYREAKYSKRKSPIEPAKNYKEGTIKKGLDGNNWKVNKSTKGIKRWVKN
jgi:hypothetical protein